MEVLDEITGVTPGVMLEDVAVIEESPVAPEMAN